MPPPAERQRRKEQLLRRWVARNPSALHAQKMAAARALSEVAGSTLGDAWRVADAWQNRLLSALRGEVPAWQGLAGFRCITDYVMLADEFLDQISTRDPLPPLPHSSKKASSLIEALQFCNVHLVTGQSAGVTDKPLVPRGSELEDFFLSRLGRCQKVLGGQAGNVAWLWHNAGAGVIAYVPYVAHALVETTAERPELGDLPLAQFIEGHMELVPICEASGGLRVAGRDGNRGSAPVGASVIVPRDGLRVIFLLDGFRDFGVGDPAQMPFDRVTFCLGDVSLGSLERDADDLTWPQLGLFCDCCLVAEEGQRTLRVGLLRPDEIIAAFEGQATYALLGGMDAVFKDEWLTKCPELQVRLERTLEGQLRALKEAGVRIGVEMSNVPSGAYFRFLQRLCQDGVVVALGVNGEQELIALMQRASLTEPALHSLWLDPAELDPELAGEARSDDVGRHFEYLTYLRARRLVEILKVPTLYVHTTRVDLLLCRDNSPGALAAARDGDMMGKALTLAALLQRAYPAAQRKDLKQPAAILPKALARLGLFAQDFARFQSQPSASRMLMYEGYWRDFAPDGFSLAAVPVMWPSEAGLREMGGLPKDLNTTGAGDMSFAAFLLLGGV